MSPCRCGLGTGKRKKAPPKKELRLSYLSGDDKEGGIGTHACQFGLDQVEKVNVCHGRKEGLLEFQEKKKKREVVDVLRTHGSGESAREKKKAIA